MGLKDWWASLKRSAPAAVQQRLDAVTAEVRAMTPDTLRAFIAQEVASGRFRAAAATGTVDTPELQPLGPITQQFFSQYKSLASPSMRVATDEVGPLARDPRYVRIGGDLEHADVLVRPGDDTILVAEDDGGPIGMPDDSHPTIWHYLAVVARTSRPGW